jgi:hypothetical protein
MDCCIWQNPKEGDLHYLFPKTTLSSRAMTPCRKIQARLCAQFEGVRRSACALRKLATPGVFLLSLLLVLPLQNAGAASAPIPRPGSESLKGRIERELALKVAGDSAGVEFELDTSRLAGVITAVNLSSGYFKYQPPKDRSITSDSFRFRAKRSGAYSPWEIFRITVSDIGPRIEVSSYLDFGSIRLGEVKELQLEISNAGDTPTEVILETNRGWFSVSPSQFLLEPNEKKSVGIRFAPSISGRALADLTVTSAGAVQLVRLAADIPTWIEVRPPTLILSPNQNQSREAVLVLRNPNSEEETVQIDSKNALLHQNSVVLPPAESVEVKFSLPSIQKQALKGVIMISNAKEFSIAVPWSAKVVPASLKTETRISPDLSILPSLIRMTNHGGVSGTWKLAVSSPFSIDNEPNQTIVLQPNDTREIRVTRPPVRKTDLIGGRALTAGSVRISGPDGEVEVRIENLVPTKPAPAKTTPVPIPKPLPKPMPTSSQDSDSQSFSLSPPPEPNNSNTNAGGASSAFPPAVLPPSTPKKIPPTESTPHFDSPIDPAIRNSILEQSAIPLLASVSVENVTSTTASIVIPYPPTPPKNYPLILRRQAKLKADSDPSFEWVLLKFDPPKRVNPEVLRYEVRGLDPGEPNAIRIVSPQLIDKSRVVVQQFNIQTPPAKVFLTWRLCLSILGVCALLGVYTQRRR